LVPESTGLRSCSTVELSDRILEANRRWAEAEFPGPAPVQPSRRLVVVTCMDSRIDVFEVAGLTNGQAHIIRNAGGVVTDDVQRSIALSQRKLGTVDLAVIQHDDCGMHGFDADAFRADLLADTGAEPGWDVPGFTDVEQSVREQIALIEASPWIRGDGDVAGFVYDPGTGRLRLIAEIDR
jgi:carbonic anhydrase